MAEKDTITIRIKTDLVWGQAIYLKNDPDQISYDLVGIQYLPGGVLKFMLKHYLDKKTREFYDFQCSVEPRIEETPT